MAVSVKMGGKKVKIESTVEKLFKKYPGKDVLHSAVLHLSKEGEIRAFYLDYINLLRSHGETTEARENPIGAAIAKIIFRLDHCEQDVRDRWDFALNAEFEMWRKALKRMKRI
jgi:hypothetical protein